MALKRFIKKIGTSQTDSGISRDALVSECVVGGQAPGVTATASLYSVNESDNLFEVFGEVGGYEFSSFIRSNKYIPESKRLNAAFIAGINAQKIEGAKKENVNRLDCDRQLTSGEFIYFKLSDVDSPAMAKVVDSINDSVLKIQIISGPNSGVIFRPEPPLGRSGRRHGRGWWREC